MGVGEPCDESEGACHRVLLFVFATEGNASAAACAVIAPSHNAPTVVLLINYSGPANERASERATDRSSSSRWGWDKCLLASKVCGAQQQQQPPSQSGDDGSKRSRQWPAGKGAPSLAARERDGSFLSGLPNNFYRVNVLHDNYNANEAAPFPR